MAARNPQTGQFTNQTGLLQVVANVVGGQQFLQTMSLLNASLQKAAVAQQQLAASATRANVAVRQSASHLRQAATAAGQMKSAFGGASAGVDRFLGGMRRATVFIGVFSGYVTHYMIRALGSLSSAFISAGKYVLQTTANFEKLRIQLRTVFREAGEAERVFGFLKGLAQQTPFQLVDVVEGAAALKAVNIDIRQTVAGGKNILTLLSDMASALGRSIPDAIFSFKEAVAEGSWISLRRRFSITMGQIEAVLRQKARSMGKTFEEVFSFDTAQGRLEALSTFISASYGGGSEALAQTFMGIKNNLVDAAQVFADMVGSSGPMILLKQQAQEVFETVQMMFDTGRAREWAATIGTSVTRAVFQITDYVKTGLMKDVVNGGTKEKPGITIDTNQFISNATDAIEGFFKKFQEAWATNQGTIFRISRAVVETIARTWFEVFKATVSVLMEQWWGKILIGGFVFSRIVNLGQAFVSGFKGINSLVTAFGSLSKYFESMARSGGNIAAGTGVLMGSGSGARKGIGGRLGGALGVAGMGAASLGIGYGIGSVISEYQQNNLQERADEAKKTYEAINNRAKTLTGLLRAVREGKQGASALFEKLGGSNAVRQGIRGTNDARAIVDASEDDNAVTRFFKSFVAGKSSTGSAEAFAAMDSAFGPESLARVEEYLAKVAQVEAQVKRVFEIQVGHGKDAVSFNPFGDGGALSDEGKMFIGDQTAARLEEINQQNEDAMNNITEQLSEIRAKRDAILSAQKGSIDADETSAQILGENVTKLERELNVMRNANKVRAEYARIFGLIEKKKSELALQTSKMGQARSLLALDASGSLVTPLSGGQKSELTTFLSTARDRATILREELDDLNQTSMRLLTENGGVAGLSGITEDFVKKTQELGDKWRAVGDAVANVGEKLAALAGNVGKPLRDFQSIEAFVKETFGKGFKDKTGSSAFDSGLQASTEEERNLRREIEAGDREIAALKNIIAANAGNTGPGAPPDARAAALIATRDAEVRLRTSEEIQAARVDRLGAVIEEIIRSSGERYKELTLKKEELEKRMPETALDQREAALQRELKLLQADLDMMYPTGSQSLRDQQEKPLRDALEEIASKREGMAGKDLSKTAAEDRASYAIILAKLKELDEFAAAPMKILLQDLAKIAGEQTDTQRNRFDKLMQTLNEMLAELKGGRTLREFTNAQVKASRDAMLESVGLSMGEVDEAGDPNNRERFKQEYRDLLTSMMKNGVDMTSSPAHLEALIKATMASQSTQMASWDNLMKTLSDLAGSVRISDDLKKRMVSDTNVWIHLVSPDGEVQSQQADTSGDFVFTGPDGG